MSHWKVWQQNLFLCSNKLLSSSGWRTWSWPSGRGWVWSSWSTSSCPSPVGVSAGRSVSSLTERKYQNFILWCIVQAFIVVQHIVTCQLRMKNFNQVNMAVKGILYSICAKNWILYSDHPNWLLLCVGHLWLYWPSFPLSLTLLE